MRGLLNLTSIILLDVMDFAVGINYWNFIKYHQMSTVLNEEETIQKKNGWKMLVGSSEESKFKWP